MKEQTKNDIADGAGCLVVLIFFGFVCWGLWRLFIFEPRHTTTKPPRQEPTVSTTTTTTTTSPPIPRSNITVISKASNDDTLGDVTHIRIDGLDCIVSSYYRNFVCTAPMNTK